MAKLSLWIVSYPSGMVSSVNLDRGPTDHPDFSRCFAPGAINSARFCKTEIARVGNFCQRKLHVGGVREFGAESGTSPQSGRSPAGSPTESGGVRHESVGTGLYF